MITKTEVFNKKQQIRNNSEVARRSMESLYEFQTMLEQQVHETIFKNRVGFNKNDAPTLSNIITKIENDEEITEEDYSQMKRRMVKYSRQLLEIERKF